MKGKRQRGARRGRNRRKGKGWCAKGGAPTGFKHKGLQERKEKRKVDRAKEDERKERKVGKEKKEGEMMERETERDRERQRETESLLSP